MAALREAVLRENAMAGVNQNQSLLYFLEFLSYPKIKKLFLRERFGGGVRGAMLGT